MAPVIRRPVPVRPMPAGLKPKPPEAQKPPVETLEEGVTKTATVRLSSSHFSMLEELRAVLESDKSEAIKRSIRLAHLAMSEPNVSLHLTDASGATVVIPVMKAGRPV